jgi:hypothetical protein
VVVTRNGETKHKTQMSQFGMSLVTLPDNSKAAFKRAVLRNHIGTGTSAVPDDRMTRVRFWKARL